MGSKRKLYLAGIEPESIVDGPGIRLVLFCQGCSRKCPGCHNPSTWPLEGGVEIGTDEILQMARENPLCHGVTFSGGEPFLQADVLAGLAASLRKEGFEVACYTGYSIEELMEGSLDQKRLLDSIDILIDGPYVEERHSLELKFRGSLNQRILDVQRSLLEGRAVLSTDQRWRDTDGNP